METQNIEYKVKWKDEYLHYISGFANADGGTLFIGLDDNGNIVGIDNAKLLLVNLPNKAVQATGIVPEINLLTANDKEYVAIHIMRSEQPVSCNGKYYLRSGSTLQVWADHIELWNQGTLPPDYTIDTLMQDHESYPRNTLIADAFFRAGFIEAWGRGFEKIREAFKDEQLQMPTFEQVRGGVLATIKREKFIAMQQQKDGASGASGASTIPHFPT